MKKWLIFSLLIGSFSFAQEFKQIKVFGENRTQVLKDVSVSLETNSLSYTNKNGEFITESLDGYQKIQYKKGSQWLAGMLGGMVGGFLGNAIFRGEDEEIWYGAGPPILFGGLIGAVVGSFSPRYKVLEKENTSVSVSLNSIKYTF